MGLSGVRPHVLVGSIVVLLFTSGPALGHAGPPIPLVSNRIVGPYKVSIWADPDSTDDGTAAGRFWITVAYAATARHARAGRIRPLGRAWSRRSRPRLNQRKECVAAVFSARDGS